MGLFGLFRGPRADRPRTSQRPSPWPTSPTRGGPAPDGAGVPLPGEVDGPAAAAPGSNDAAIAQNARIAVQIYRDDYEVELDFSRASLARVDEVLGLFHDSRTKLPTPFGRFTGYYVSEVARKEFGGGYFVIDEEPGSILVIGEPARGVIYHAYDKVFGRVENGPEDDLTFFHDGIPDALSRPGGGHLV
jgi:hypothetical protein